MTQAGVVDWYPQQYAAVLFAVKALLGLIAVVMLIIHMSRTWSYLRSRGQRARYITLLAYAILVTGSSTEQIAEGTQVSYRHLASLVVALMLIGTMVISLGEDHKRGSTQRGH